MLSASLPHISAHRRPVSPFIFQGSQTVRSERPLACDEKIDSRARKPSNVDGADENVEPRPEALRRVSASSTLSVRLAPPPDSNEEIVSCQQPPTHLNKEKRISLKLRSQLRSPPTSTQLRQVQLRPNSKEEVLPNPLQWNIARKASRSSNGSPRPYRFLVDNPFPSLESLTLSGGNTDNLQNSEVPWTVGRSFRHGSLELDYVNQDATCTAVRSSSSSYPTEGQHSSDEVGSPPHGSVRDRWFVSLGRFSKPYGRLSLLFRTSSSSGYGQKTHETFDEDNQYKQDTATTVDSSEDVSTISAKDTESNAASRIDGLVTAENGISGHHVPEVQEITSPALDMYKPFLKAESSPIRNMELVAPRKLQRNSIHNSLFEGLEKACVCAATISTDPLLEASSQTIHCTPHADSLSAAHSPVIFQRTDGKLAVNDSSEGSLKSESKSRTDGRRLRGGGGGLEKLLLKLENSRLARYYRHKLRKSTSHGIDVSDSQNWRYMMRKEKIPWYQPWRRVKWFKGAQYPKEPRGTRDTPRPRSSADGVLGRATITSSGPSEESRGVQTSSQRQGSRFITEFDKDEGRLMNQEPDDAALHCENLRAGMGAHLEQIVEVSSEFERSILEESVGTTTAQAGPFEQPPPRPLAEIQEILNAGVEGPLVSKKSDEQRHSEADIPSVPDLASVDTLVSGMQGAAMPSRPTSRAATVMSTGIDSLTNKDNFGEDTGYLFSADSINSVTFPLSETICDHNYVGVSSSLAM